MKFTALYLLLTHSLLSQGTIAIQDPSDPHRGRLSGVVLDERARPARGVTVKATPPGPIGAVLPHTQTDAKGRFALDGLLPGHTYVNAFNEEHFYADASSNFWDGQGAAEVELPVGGEVSGIVLKLTPAGRLHVAAKSATDQAVIGQIGVRLERDGAPSRWMTSSKLGNWWLVPTAPILLCVEAEGFQAAWYGRDGSFDHSVPITLTPNRVFRAMVSLRPLNSATTDATCSSTRSR